jgi:hypothetical protein
LRGSGGAAHPVVKMADDGECLVKEPVDVAST